eukprot:TRINITY_DN16011_c0_g1_i2.p1 TRINITY_DN16011_c0_g1~~TRINITY_DN16011_c0_g1_i2.p1  ORF type:complete len:234 (+),score=56.07 TRINITY_DN16011_c0_g1_i2:50-751(+)
MSTLLVYLRDEVGRVVPVEVASRATVGQLKAEAEAVLGRGLPGEQLVLGDSVLGRADAALADVGLSAQAMLTLTAKRDPWQAAQVGACLVMRHDEYGLVVELLAGSNGWFRVQTAAMAGQETARVVWPNKLPGMMQDLENESLKCIRKLEREREEHRLLALLPIAPDVFTHGYWEGLRSTDGGSTWRCTLPNCNSFVWLHADGVGVLAVSSRGGARARCWRVLRHGDVEETAD